MSTYRYILDKSSKKFKCPKCGKMRFVKFLDIETRNYLEDHYGRCDRESSCGYIRHPKNKRDESFIPVEIPEIIPSFHDIELVEKTHKSFNNNNLYCFLSSIFPKEEVDLAFEKYKIGTSKCWDGATIFWQLDNELRVRHGKIMLYDEKSGKRKKANDGTAFINSVRRVLNLKDFNLEQCLFGLHLIRGLDPKKDKIIIVESEKTAVIGSLFSPKYTWLATGSKSGFKQSYLSRIKAFKIIAFPDKSEYNDWLEKSEKLNEKGYNISISNWIESRNYKAGYDLADIIVKTKISEQVST